MTSSETNYTFGDLSIQRIIIDGKGYREKYLTIMKNHGTHYEELYPDNPDYNKAIILMLNKENGHD